MDLKEVMIEENKALHSLYETLVDQNQYLVNKEVFSLDKVAKIIEDKSKMIAKLEIARRNITHNVPMRDIIKKAQDEKLEKLYVNIVELIEKMQIQKDTNEALIKQWLGFTTQMLRAISPGRQPATYNSLGRNR